MLFSVDSFYLDGTMHALLRRDAILFVSSAGIAQLVEHNLAKVGVASSNLVSRSNFFYQEIGNMYILAEWQNGHAADCKSVDLGSTPGSASTILTQLV